MRKRLFRLLTYAFLASLIGTGGFGGSAAYGQGGKPAAAVAPLAAIGKITEGQKRIIHTSLEALLAQSYKLVADTDYQKAEEAAVQELDLAQ